MTRGVLLNNDQYVADWTWKKFHLHPMPVNMAIGLLDTKGGLVGSAMFYWYNGANVELDYFGPKTITLGIARMLATIAYKHFNVQRVTVRTERDNMEVIRGVQKFGFKLEGTEHRFYANGKDAVRLVLFREDLAKLVKGE